MSYEAIKEKEQRDRHMREMNRAKNALEEIKQLKVSTGPNSQAIANISTKVHKIVTERDAKKTFSDLEATLLLSKGELNDRIRLAMSEEEQNMKE